MSSGNLLRPQDVASRHEENESDLRWLGFFYYIGVLLHYLHTIKL